MSDDSLEPNAAYAARTHCGLVVCVHSLMLAVEGRGYIGFLASHMASE